MAFSDNLRSFSEGFATQYLAASQLQLERQRLALQERYQKSLMDLNAAQGEYYRQRQTTQSNPMSSDEILADYMQNPGKYSPEQIALIQKYKGSDRGLTAAVFDLAGAIGLTKGNLAPTTSTGAGQDLSGIVPATTAGDAAYPKDAGYGPTSIAIPAQPLPSTVVGAIGQQAGLAGKEAGLNVKGMGVSNRGVDIAYEAPANLSEEDKKNFKNWSALYDYSQWLKTNKESVSMAAGLEASVATAPLVGKWIEGNPATNTITGGNTGTIFRTIMDAGFATMMKERGGTAVSPTELGLNEAWFPGKYDTDTTIQNKAEALEYMARQNLMRMSKVNAAGGFKNMSWNTGVLGQSENPPAKQEMFIGPTAPSGSQFEIPESLRGNTTARWSEKHKGWFVQEGDEGYVYKQDGRKVKLVQRQPTP